MSDAKTVHAIVNRAGDYVGAVYANDLVRFYQVEADPFFVLNMFNHAEVFTDCEPMSEDHSCYCLAHDDAENTREELNRTL